MFTDHSSFINFAMKVYDNPSCKTIKEFESDVHKFKLLSRLCAYKTSDKSTKLILNLMMMLLNLFGESAIKMMFYKIRISDWDKIKTVLVYLNRMPVSIPELNLLDSEIQLCKEMISILRLI
jgi:hypothetical protein